MDDDELVEMVRDAISKQRPYAGFFDWPERSIAEWGAVNAFSEIASSEPGFPLREIEPRPSGEDPPDCEAVDANGRAMAIEVTELVDGSAIAAARRTGRVDFATWGPAQIRAQIDHLLTAKDSKVLKGGPYDEYVVLIHTDEPAVTPEQIAVALDGHELPAMKQVHRAYLLLSYDPHRRRYPYFRLI
jgi:hypothetical protein